MEIRVYTDVVTEPVTLAELRNYLKIDQDNTAEDSLITTIGKAARELLEQRFNLSLATKTLIATFEVLDIDSNRITLPRSPIQSVVSVNRINNEGTRETLTLNSGYFATGDTVKEIEVRSYPFMDELETVTETYEIQYVAGYTTLPSIIKMCILDVAKSMYDDRGATSEPLSDKVYMNMRPYSRNRVL